MFKIKYILYIRTPSSYIYTRIKYYVCKIKYICPTRVNIICIHEYFLNINARTHTLPFKFLTSYVISQ